MRDLQSIITTVVTLSFSKLIFNSCLTFSVIFLYCVSLSFSLSLPPKSIGILRYGRVLLFNLPMSYVM